MHPPGGGERGCEGTEASGVRWLRSEISQSAVLVGRVYFILIFFSLLMAYVFTCSLSIHTQYHLVYSKCTSPVVMVGAHSVPSLIMIEFQIIDIFIIITRVHGLLMIIID